MCCVWGRTSYGRATLTHTLLAGKKTEDGKLPSQAGYSSFFVPPSPLRRWNGADPAAAMLPVESGKQ